MAARLQLRCFADGTEFAALEGAARGRIRGGVSGQPSGYECHIRLRDVREGGSSIGLGRGVEREEDDSVCAQQSCSWIAPEFRRFWSP